MNGAFKSLPTFDKICERVDAMEKCVAAQGEIILELMAQVREREYEIAFLMNISYVTIPTSRVAGPDGKIPAIRKSARDAYVENGRAKIVQMFEAAEKAAQDEQNLQEALHPSEESPAAPENREGAIPFTLPGKVTH